MFRFLSIYKFYQINYYRKILKGYRNLKNIDNYKLIFNLKKDLTKVKLNFKNNIYDKFLFINYKDFNSEIIIRQYILSKFLNSYFNRHILYYYGDNKTKFDYGYPPEWINLLKKKNIKVNLTKSLFNWKLKTFLSLLDSFRIYLKILLNSLNNNLIKNINSNTIYISSLTDNLIESSLKGFTTINWIQKFITEKTKIKHKVLVESQKKFLYYKQFNEKGIFIDKPFESLKNRYLIIPITFWYLRAFIICLLDSIFSKGYRAFILTESLKTKVYQLNFKNNKLNYCFYSCSDWIYRPIWTYWAERNNSNIIFYFYSTNIFQLSQNKNFSFPDIINYGWESNTWKNFYVWNKNQSDFIKQLPNKANVEIVGPILFQDDNKKDLSLKKISSKKKLALFDISIFRNFLFQTEGHLTCYETPEVAIRFITDVLELCIDLDIHILYKSKRDLSKKIHPKYKSFIRNLSNKYFHFISYDVSPNYLINISEGCISFPFTSTSLLAKFQNKKCCFYDPTSKLIPYKIQTNNITLIKGKVKLKDWLSSL